MVQTLPTSLRRRLPEPERLDRWVLPTWLLTRGLILALVFLIGRGDAARMQDVGYYLEVARHIVDTRTMPATEMWQYPPGAALVLVMPLLAGVAGYATAFVLFMAACDAAITRMLLALGRRHGSRLGLWAWLLAMPWLREYPMLRFDLVPALLAVAALAVLARRPALLGLLAGAGALVKAWPVIVLAAEWRPRRVLVATVLAATTFLGGIGIAGALLGPQGGALDNQAGRGLQTESVAATPWHVEAIADGRLAELRYGSGASEIADPRAEQVADSLRWATLAAAAVLGAWWALRMVLLRRDPLALGHLASAAAGIDLVFVGVLLAMVTSRVLSPQFMVWLLAVAAVALCARDTRMHVPAWLVLAATILTFGVLRFPEALVVRNALLVAASVAGLVQLLRMLAPSAAAGRSGLHDEVQLERSDPLHEQPAVGREPLHVVD